MATLKAQNDAFKEAFLAAYPQFQPIIEEKDPNYAPESVERDFIHIATEPFEKLKSSMFPYKLILQQISQVSGLAIAEIVSPRRQRHIVYWRTIAAYLMRKHTAVSYPVIGNRLGGRDHSTIIHACRIVERNPDKFHADINRVESLL